MRLLLDTHIVLWQLSGSRRLSDEAEQAIGQAAELFFSVVSFAEIGVKAAVGKLSVPADLRTRIVDDGVTILGLDADVGLSVADLPMHHRDPFDRLLVAQAASAQLSLITADQRLMAYDIHVIDGG